MTFLRQIRLSKQYKQITMKKHPQIFRKLTHKIKTHLSPLPTNPYKSYFTVNITILGITL